jgi:hypothetical protein
MASVLVEIISQFKPADPFCDDTWPTIRRAATAVMARGASDEAIQLFLVALDCFASLATTC